MRAVTGAMGMQKAGVLLGVHGDNLTDSADTRARRIMTPQREYPIFTPGTRESAVPASSSDYSRASFQDSDGQGIWKEIHTDTPSTPGHSSSHSLCFDTGHILTPSVSATSLEHSGPLLPTKLGSLHNSPRPEYVMEPPAMMMSPCSEGMLSAGRIAMNASGSNYFISVPNTPAGQRNFNLPKRQSPRHASPAARTAMAHSPQNINILSPHLRPLEKSPKLTQLHIASPRMPEMIPMVNQLGLSPDQQPGSRPAFDVNDPRMMPSTMLPPSSVAGSDPHQVPLSSPGHAGPLSSTLSLKKLMKSRQAEQSPRSSVSKDRSPRSTWKMSFRAVSPLATIRSNESRQAVRGLTRDVNSSFQEKKSRGNHINNNSSSNNNNNTNNAAACVNSSNLPSWREGGQAVVAQTALEREVSQDSSGDFEPPDPPQLKVGGKKVASTQKSGTYNIFGFLNWGKKKNSSQSGLKLNESFQSDMASVKPDTDSIKVLDYTIKTLRYKLEQANQKCAAAVDEVRALQAAAEASDEKCRMLTQRCQDLELQLSARRSGLHWDMELEAENPTYIVGRREAHTPAPIGPPQISRRFSSQELTPEQFLKVFEESQACIRKLASAICHHIRDSGESATQVITSLLEQHKVGRWVSRMPRNVIILYFESFLNQVMFESFENVSFEPNGASSVFDPDTLKQTCYQAYQNLKNQEWVNIEKSLGKPGALVVNASFHRFFVVRMELILSQLGKLAESEISLSLMASFFNAVKSVWLVHHLAFAFDQPVSIFRVSPSAEFDPRFMEQIPAFEEEPVRSKISIMVNPGFIVNRQTIKCQVYCSSTYQ